MLDVCLYGCVFTCIRMCTCTYLGVLFVFDVCLYGEVVSAHGREETQTRLCHVSLHAEHLLQNNVQ